MSQKNAASLFDTSADNISLRLKNIYTEDDLNEKSTTEDFSAVQIEGSREVKCNVKHYNLDAIIAVGYRVNSKRATAFRQWVTGVLRDYALRGCWEEIYSTAKEHADSEFEKYRMIQDKLSESDFDKQIKLLEQEIAKSEGPDTF